MCDNFSQILKLPGLIRFRNPGFHFGGLCPKLQRAILVTYQVNAHAFEFDRRQRNGAAHQGRSADRNIDRGGCDDPDPILIDQHHIGCSYLDIFFLPVPEKFDPLQLDSKSTRQAGNGLLDREDQLVELDWIRGKAPE